MKKQKLKGLFINVVEKTVSEVEIVNNLESIYELLNCETIESGYGYLFASANHVMFVDEEGLLKTPLGAFQIFDYPPISGNAIIFSSDEEGELQDHYCIIEKIRVMVKFCDITELPEPNIKVFSWEDFFPNN